GRGAVTAPAVLLCGAQGAKTGLACADRVLLAKIAPVVARRAHRRDLRVEPIDPLIGVHVQLSDKAASDKAYSYCRHHRAPSRESSSYCLRPCAKALRGAVRRRPRRLVHIGELSRRRRAVRSIS